MNNLEIPINSIDLISETLFQDSALSVQTGTNSIKFSNAFI